MRPISYHVQRRNHVQVQEVPAHHGVCKHRVFSSLFLAGLRWRGKHCYPRAGVRRLWFDLVWRWCLHGCRRVGKLTQKESGLVPAPFIYLIALYSLSTLFDIINFLLDSILCFMLSIIFLSSSYWCLANWYISNSL